MSQSSVIGPGTTVHGSVSGEGSLEIFGRVEGSVSMTGDVSLSSSAQVLGDISGTTISVQGTVQGDLRGTEAVLLERGARVVGDLSAPRIGVASGALVRGTVRTEGEPALGAAKRPAATAFKPPAFVAKPVAKVEPKPAPLAPARAELSVVADDEAPPLAAPAVPAPRAKEAERRPPPPVLPSLGKGVKATKKKGRDE
jgi:cytoskeletal protein CcmA (bactofilin family)